jgi:hypothetical protein
MDTYLDGVATMRCRACHSALRTADDEPVVAIRVSDAEDLVRLLIEYVDCGEVWNDTILRLEHAVGRTYDQIRRAHEPPAEDA